MKCIVTFVFCVLILTSCSSSNTQSISDGTNTTGETTVKQEKVGFSCSGEDCGFKNNSIADFMKKLPYDKKVGKLDGKYVFIDPEMGRYQWALTFENSPKAMTGSESINGVTVVFDRDFKILSQS